MRTETDPIHRIFSTIFAVFALTVFSLFIFLHPLDWQQPETLRMHYYSLQSGVRDGPLTSGPVITDLLKPLSNKARGGTYEARYFVKLLDGMKVRLYQLFYRITGPFLGEPLVLILLLMTAGLLVLAIHEWFASWPAALVAASVWLISTQTLLDARYPIRPNMALASLLSVYILWEVLRLRRVKFGRNPIIRIGLALFLSISSQEASFCMIPAVVAVMLLQKKSLRRHLPGLSISLLSVLIAYGVFYLVVVKYFMRHLAGEEPLLFQLQDASPLMLLKLQVFWGRFRECTIGGLLYFIRLNLGMCETVAFWERIVGGVAVVFLLGATIRSGWRVVISPLIMFLSFYLPFSLIMFPLAPGAVEMPVYYYAIVTVLAAFPLGALLAALAHGRKRGRGIVALGSLVVISAININAAAGVMRELPGAFGFNAGMRTFTRDILKMGERVSSGEIPSPAYMSYPRPRRMDISAKWDIMLRVWHGEADQVFALMMPVLYLRYFEDGTFRGNSEEFSAWLGVDEGKYEKPVIAFADLPHRGWYDLRLIRDSKINPDLPPLWRSAGGESIRAEEDETLLGTTYRSSLSSGNWKSSIQFLSPAGDKATLLLLVKGDLQADGAEDVYYRTEPLREYRCRVLIRGQSGQVVRRHSLGWSYQWYQVPLDKIGGTQSIEIEIKTDKKVEVVGPVLIFPRDIPFHPWYQERNI
ncbi:MAG TPA: hypothetical protein ENH12_04905 [Proteobacteria bacterium]|nr:hypothetical protein [Pseudomonadota bacterium]